MTIEEFDVLVATLETAQKKQPKWFLVSTMLFAMLGFLYLILVLAFSLSCTLGLVSLVLLYPHAATLKLALIFGVLFGGMSWAILRALWVRLQPPEGIRLTDENAPTLLNQIEELRRRIGSARFHNVLLDGQYNACVVQTPRLGMFGWHRNYLLLGLPLMQSMSPTEFEAVLGHEFAHLAGGHGRFGNWLYRLRRSWERLIEHLQQHSSGGAAMLTGFLKWFWPRFNARAFVLSRANEYEADALAAHLFGAGTIASALKRIAVYCRHLDEAFWEKVFRRANQEPEPPENIFASMPAVLREGPASQDGEKWMRQAYLMRTTTVDTHPCLSERLSALGQLPDKDRYSEMPVLHGASAAQTLLAENESALTIALGKVWAKKVRPLWLARHEETKQLSARLDEVSIEVTGEGEIKKTVEALWKQADAVAGLEGSKAAQSIITRILELDSEHAGALFARGAFRADQDDQSGIDDLEKSIELDESFENNALQIIGAFHHRHGNQEAGKALQRRWEAYEKKMEEVQDERSRVELHETYLPHDLTDFELQNIRIHLAKEPWITKACCARKQTVHLTKQPMYIMVLHLRVAWWKLRTSGATQKLVNRVLTDLELRGTSIVFVNEKNLKSLGKKITELKGTVVYEKENVF